MEKAKDSRSEGVKESRIQGFKWFSWNLFSKPKEARSRKSDYLSQSPQRTLRKARKTRYACGQNSETDEFCPHFMPLAGQK
ncbi:MAG: hypothetical protein LC100_17035 [Chitinophagales bacterium]|nr:hypothetical protein [Chitinophagales bacterium]